MLHTPRKSSRAPPPNRICNLIPGTTLLHNLLLRMRRLRRVSRPILPLIIRFFIVLFSVIELKPHIPITSINTTPPIIPSLPYLQLLPFLSRATVILAILSALLSVIFFDVRILNVVTVVAILLNLVTTMYDHSHRSIYHLLTIATFHCTAILFTALVGRRRSISKPSALRASMLGNQNKPYYLAILRGLRNVDVLEAATRLQAAILLLDFSLAHTNGLSVFLFTSPFALSFLFGYATQKNGTLVLLLLCALAASMQSSAVLTFDFVKTISTIAAGFLGLVVGPGLLTVDEWLATANQLCY